MKKTHIIFYLVIILLFLSFSLITAQNKPQKKDSYGKQDMMSVVVDQKAGSDKAVAKVNLVNDEKITAIVLPIKYGTGKTPITLDSVSFADTRVKDFAFKFPNIDPKIQKVNIALISTLSSAQIFLPKGEGEIAKLYFTLKKGGEEKTILLDTTTFEPANVLQMVEAEDNTAQAVYPVFDNSKGKIKLLK
ncbi:MAG: hypothetical protein OEV55_05385 [candidate division Zixibacteria bacterium]|nr:hypothetical protein [candidate division Zixibacteria bacterium]